MSSFLTPLVVSPMPDGRRWKLFYPFTFVWRSGGLNIRIDVPKGFVTDFASSPFFVWTFIPPWGRYGKSAIIHDFLYQNKLTQPRNIWERIFSRERKDADRIFLDGMRVLGVPKWKRKLMYWGVRASGWLAWRRK